MRYVVETTKTTCGTRRISMTAKVADAFKSIISNRKKSKVEPMIDGYTGFLVLSKNEMPIVALH